MNKIAPAILALVFFLNVRPVLAEPLIVLAMGDSTTAGTPGFRSPIEAAPDGRGNPESQYSYWLGKNFPEWKILNRGVNGEKTDQISRRLQRDLETIKPQIVILIAGVNDLHQGYSVDYVTRNLETMYKLIEKSGVKVVIGTILPYDQARPEVLSKIREVNGWIRGYAAAQGYLFCDTYAAVENPDKPGKLLGSPDGLHPDPAGYRKIGESLAGVLRKEF